MNADAIVELAAQVLAERLAKEPNRIAELIAGAERAAWAAAEERLRDALAAAILAAAAQQAPAQPGPAPAEPAAHAAEPEPASTTPQPIAPAPTVTEPVELTRSDPPAAPPETGAGVYVYGIIDDPSLALPALPGMVEGKSVRLYPYRSLAAVVSEVPLDEFGQAAIEANLSDMAWLERRVRTHQAVQDALLPLANLLPMKFATIYFNMSGLDTLFAEKFEEFETVLEHLRGQQEWGVKLFIDRAQLLEHIDAYSSTVKQLRAEMEGKPQGAAYFVARRLQQVASDEVERVSFTVADEVNDRLIECSRAARLGALPSDQEAAERLVLSGAYLVARAGASAFQAAVDELAEHHAGQGFRLELSGPWAPYNFVDLAWLQEAEE